MKFTKKTTTNFPWVLAIFCTGIFIGEAIHPVPGLSPYYMATGQLEERVFPETRNPSDPIENSSEAVKNQIVKVLAKYKTGLEPGFKKKIPAMIIQESGKYDYDPLFLTALIITESSFNNWARSRRGAMGLMQIKPRTGVALAKEISQEWNGNPTLYDPGANIALGAYYLNKLIKRFGDRDLALEAYNHGPTRLSGYLRKGFRPKGYSRKVNDHYERIRSLPI